MPRVSDLVRPDYNSRLSHPVVGYVNWKPEYPGSPARILVWANGPEKGKPLVVDETVLFCDRWRRA